MDEKADEETDKDRKQGSSGKQVGQGNHDDDSLAVTGDQQMVMREDQKVAKRGIASKSVDVASQGLRGSGRPWV